jgi:hypothetical protein
MQYLSICSTTDSTVRVPAKMVMIDLINDASSVSVASNARKNIERRLFTFAVTASSERGGRITDTMGDVRTEVRTGVVSTVFCLGLISSEGAVSIGIGLSNLARFCAESESGSSRLFRL